MAAATRDRDGQHRSGVEQWYEVGSSARIYRHTFLGVDGSGLLVPMRDAEGSVYVGVSGAAVYPVTGAGTKLGGRRRCPVLQAGELTFEYGGSSGQAAVGQPAYLLDDQTVTDAPEETEARIAVGRLVGVYPRGHPEHGRCRVLITGYASLALAVFLGQVRQKVRLDPKTFSGLNAGSNYRIAVTLPAAFGDVTYAAKLLCDEASVVVNEDTGPKTAGKVYWNVFVPTALGGGSGGVELTFTPYFAGEGWPLGTGPYAGEWDEPTELL